MIRSKIIFTSYEHGIIIIGKNVDWLATLKYPEIKKTHFWLKETFNSKAYCFSAKTDDLSCEVETKKKKSFNKNKITKGRNIKI